MLLDSEDKWVTHTHCDFNIKIIRMNQASQNWGYTVCFYSHNCIKWKRCWKQIKGWLGKAIWGSQGSIGSGRDVRCIHHLECGDGFGGLYTQNSSGFTLEVCAVCCVLRMLPRLCLGERLVLKVHLCDQKQNSWVLYMWTPLVGGKEGQENTYLTKAFETLGCSSEHSTVHSLGEHSLLSLLCWI